MWITRLLILLVKVSFLLIDLVAFCSTHEKFSGLNGMQLQEKSLVVQRAQVGARKDLDADSHVQDVPLSIEAFQNPDVQTILNVNISTSAMLGALIAHSGRAKPSRVLQIMNCFSRERLCNDDEYVEIIFDMEEEMAKYGKVVSVVVPRPNVLDIKKNLYSEMDLPDSMTDPPGTGRVRRYLSNFRFTSLLFALLSVY
jgi:hypothetical protein